MRARANRVTSMWDESSELVQRFIQDNRSGGELLVIINKEGTSLYYERGFK
jgi:hypothetical protein